MVRTHHIYLVAANNAKDDETVKKSAFIDLGSIKGNIGDQNYELPAGVDLSKYRNVTVWCKRFGVNFATAPLASARVETLRKDFSLWSK